MAGRASLLLNGRRELPMCRSSFSWWGAGGQGRGCLRGTETTAGSWGLSEETGAVGNCWWDLPAVLKGTWTPESQGSRKREKHSEMREV